MSRADDERTINDHFGLDSEQGQKLLGEVIAAYGLSHLSDTVIADLAVRHREASDGAMATRIRAAS